jgi:hypothetical protein
MPCEKIPLLIRSSPTGVFCSRFPGARTVLRFLKAAVFCALLTGRPALGAEATTVWDYKSEAAMPDAWNGAEVRVAPEVKTPDHQAVLEINPAYGSEDLSWPSHINFWTRMTRYHDPKSVDVGFWAKGEPGTELHIRIVNECHATLSEVSKIVMSGEWQKVAFHEELRQPVGMRWVCLPRIMLGKVKAGQKFWLGPVSVRVVEGDDK